MVSQLLPMSSRVRTSNGIFRPLSNPTRKQYIARMKTNSPASPSWPLRLAIVTALGALLLAALAGWSMHGTTILFTYAQEGLAWCF